MSDIRETVRQALQFAALLSPRETDDWIVSSLPASLCDFTLAERAEELFLVWGPVDRGAGGCRR